MKKIKNAVTILISTLLIMQNGNLSAFATNSVKPALVPEYGTELYKLDFEDGVVPEDLTVWKGVDVSPQQISNPNLSVISDPSSEKRGEVLKLVPDSTGSMTMNVVRFAEDKIVFEKDCPVWVEYDFYIPNPSNVRDMANFWNANGGWSFNECPYYNAHDSSTYYIKGWNVHGTSLPAFIDGKYEHVRFKLVWQEGTGNVVVTADLKGGYTHTYTTSWATADGKGPKAFALGIESRSNSVAPDEYMCIDNFIVWKENKETPKEYANIPGIIAEDNMDSYQTVAFGQLPNNGTGFSEPWKGDRRIEGKYLHTAYYNSDFDNSGVIDSRHFNKAVDLSKPGIYEAHMSTFTYDYGELGKESSALYFGSDKLSAGFKNTSSGQNIYLKAGNQTIVGAENLSRGDTVKTIKLKMTVLNGNGIGTLEAKAWNEASNEPLEYNVKIENVNLFEIVDKKYLDWIGISGGVANRHKGFKIVKENENLVRNSYTFTNKYGEPLSKSVSISDLKFGLKVNSQFTNTNSGIYSILPVMVAYNNDNEVIAYEQGEKTDMIALTNIPKTISDFGFDEIPQNTSCIKIYFLNYYTKKPFKHYQDLTLTIQ